MVVLPLDCVEVGVDQSVTARCLAFACLAAHHCVDLAPPSAAGHRRRWRIATSGSLAPADRVVVVQAKL